MYAHLLNIWVSSGRMWKICKAGFGTFEVVEDIEYDSAKLYIQLAFLFKNVWGCATRQVTSRPAIYQSSNIFIMYVIVHLTNIK